MSLFRDMAVLRAMVLGRMGRMPPPIQERVLYPSHRPLPLGSKGIREGGSEKEKAPARGHTPGLIDLGSLEIVPVGRLRHTP